MRVMSSPKEQEHAPVEDILQDPSANAKIDVPQALDSSTSFCSQGALFAVLGRQLVEQVLVVLQELQEPQVRFRSGVDEGGRAMTEQVLKGLRAPSEQAKSSLFNTGRSDLLQLGPSDALVQVGSEGPVVQGRGSDRHI